ncbi:90R [Human adenovirus 4p]|uniref:90R n=2 Tax=Human mastadenovirus E TaxID=130308 RepID=A0A3G9CMS5_ADE04|nr:E4-90R [Human mastadenovirus E]BAU59128.1 90R [Human adenovirus 4p]BAU59247.1 90R [Human adenovirus 4p]
MFVAMAPSSNFIPLAQLMLLSIASPVVTCNPLFRVIFIFPLSSNVSGEANCTARALPLSPKPEPKARANVFKIVDFNILNGGETCKDSFPSLVYKGVSMLREMVLLEKLRGAMALFTVFAMSFPESSRSTPSPSLRVISPFLVVTGSASLRDNTPRGFSWNPSEETKGGLMKGTVGALSAS